MSVLLLEEKLNEKFDQKVEILMNTINYEQKQGVNCTLVKSNLFEFETGTTKFFWFKLRCHRFVTYQLLLYNAIDHGSSYCISLKFHTNHRKST